MILCAGEALIDMLPRESTVGEPAFAPHPGGAVFNTAVALGRLDEDVSFFSGLSTDLFGAQLEAALQAARVDASHAHRSGRPSTLAFVTLVDGQARYAFYDEGTAGRMLAPSDLPGLSPKALFLGGISLVVEPCAATYEALLKRESPSALTMIDPNIRPGFITDEAAYRARLGRMLPMADVIKISDEDMDWLGTAPAALLAAGSRLVCVTGGAKGVTAHWPGGDLFVPAEPAKVVDTVGAGDTFNAGLLAGLRRGGLLSKPALMALSPDLLRPALELGVKAAAVTVSRAGANPPWQEELA